MCEEYFALTKQNIEKYGPETVVFLQCGDFFEMYGTQDPTTNEIIDSPISVLAAHCSLAIAKKSHTFQGRTVMMAGCNVSTVDKYVQMMVDYGYTVAVYIQKDETCPKTRKKIRVLDTIHSPGTHISADVDRMEDTSNHVMSIWLETAFSRRHPNKMVYGVAVLNIYNGQSSIYEAIVDSKIESTSFDELDRIVSIYRPKECLFVLNPSARDANIKDAMYQYSGLSQMPHSKIHVYSTDDEDCIKCSKQTYIQQVLEDRFGADCFVHCREFMQHMYATQSFCFLLHFIQERNGNLVRNIYLPIFHNVSKRMLLANHTLRQLNVISDQSEDGKMVGHLQSVHSFLNKCHTPMGKRRFHYLLTHPCFDEEWLQREYQTMEIVLKTESNRENMTSTRKILSLIGDMDKVQRQMAIGKVIPCTLYRWYKQIHHTYKLFNIYAEHIPELIPYLCTVDFSRTSNNVISTNEMVSEFPGKITNLLEFLESQLDMEECSTISSLTHFETQIIPEGICQELDALYNQQQTLLAQFDSIQTFIESIMSSASSSSRTVEYTKKATSDRNGISLQMTKARSETFKRLLSHYVSTKCPNNEIILSSDVRFMHKDVKFVSAKTNMVDISFPQLDTICTTLLRLKHQINEKTAAEYIFAIERIVSGFSQTMDACSQFIGKLDVLLAKCHCAHIYHYSQPIIDTSSTEKSFLDIADLRHVLIEQLVRQELYVTNDICLGRGDVDGILLYGTNAAGKTSMMRAVGVAIVMAQSGMYTPCTRFHFKPYKSLYSRILSTDNLFKGLSTFAVEMSELRVILKEADESSLILGDELCSGTETESALSIVMASLEHLHRKRSSIFFASHFHELVDYPELAQLHRLSLKHLDVQYDETIDGLVYDRKIKDGPGKRSYGLEVCQSLYMPSEFMERAYAIRKTHFEQYIGTMGYKTSHYNAQKIKGKCELCGKYDRTNEMHHLQEQHLADNRGYIGGTFHKNHRANLMTLCESCHDNMHNHGNVSPITSIGDNDGTDSCTVKTRKIVQRKKTTKGYKIIETEIPS
jgi:DNA mismatch repair protein MutS